MRPPPPSEGASAADLSALCKSRARRPAMVQNRRMRSPPSIVGGSRLESVALDALCESPVWTELGERAGALGFERWSFSAVPDCAGPRPLGPLRVTSYPRAYVTECAARGLYDANPGFAYAMRHDAPKPYGAVRGYIAHTAAVRSYLELNQRFDVTRGILVPFHEVFGVRAVLGLCFAGSERELEDAWNDRLESSLALAARFGLLD